MSAQPVTRQEVETPEVVLRRLRESTQRWLQQERLRPHLSSGLVALDECLGGGWPLGKVAELVGPRSCGRTTAALATVAAATGRGEVVAWIDLPDTLDPPSLAAAGVTLERVLWVRPATGEQAVRATELVLEASGFTVVVLDLVPFPHPARGEGRGERREWGAAHRSRIRGPGSGVRDPGRTVIGDQCPVIGGSLLSSPLSPLPSPPGGRGRGALALRLARAVERAGVAALVLAERPWAGALAGVTVWLERGGTQWLGGDRGGPRWLAGLSPRPALHPSRGEGRGERTELRHPSHQRRGTIEELSARNLRPLPGGWGTLPSPLSPLPLVHKG